MKSFIKSRSIQLITAALILGVILTAGILSKSERAEAKNEVRASPMFAQSLNNSILELEGKKEKAPQQNINVQNLSASNNQVAFTTPTTSYSCGATCGYSCGATCGATCGSTCVGHSTCAGSSTCVGSSTCSNTCSYTCSVTCGTTCTGRSTCAGSSTCVGTSTCSSTCSYTCSTTCSTTCSGKSTCAGSSTCVGTSTCSSTCSYTCNTTCGTTCSGKSTCAGSSTCTNSSTCKGTPSNPPSGGNSGSNNPQVNTASWGNILPDKDPTLSEKLACLNDMAWNGKNYVIVGRGKILASSDGVKWNITYSADSDHVLYGVVWNGKEYTAVGTNETKDVTIAMKSSDGKVWRTADPGIAGCLWDIAWNSKLYVAAGSKGVLAISTNGVNWTKAAISSTSDFARVIWTDNQFVAVGNGIIATSPNGQKWNRVSSQTGNFRGIAYYKGLYYICEVNGKLLTTKDFVKWNSKQITIPSGSSSYSNVVNIISGGNMLFIGLSDNRILSSSDAANWILNPLSKDYGVNNIKALNNKVFAMGPSSLYVYAPQSTTSANLQIKVLINSKVQNISPAPYMQGSIPMLPVKILQAAAGTKVTVSGNRITVTRGSKKVILIAGSSSTTLNGKSAALEVKTVLKDGTLFAPLKKVTEALGGTYVWNASIKTVTIKF